MEKNVRDVILGFDDPTFYRDYPIHPYFGAIVGRYANRIANGSFTLDNFVYHTPLNEKTDTLHGGDVGYDRRIWTVLSNDTTTVVFNLIDGNLVEAFPGMVNVTITYKVTQDSKLQIHYEATADSTTVINLSSHTYWNLNGFAKNIETVLDHEMYIGASKYTPVDSTLIPTGTIDPVSTAPWLDFTITKAIGKDIARGTVTPNGGYDNNFVLDTPSLDHPIATIYAPATGIQLDMYTTQPGLQFYSGNGLDGTIRRKKDQIYSGGSENECYQRFSAFVLESQHFPDSLHHPEWPTTVLRKGEIYDHHSQYAFSIHSRK